MQPVDELGGESGGPLGAHAQLGEGDVPGSAGWLTLLDSGPVTVHQLLPLLGVRADGGVFERECGQDQNSGPGLLRSHKL